MSDQMQVAFAASRNLYPWLPYGYMSLLAKDPGAKVWMMIEDDHLPYDVPENVECVNMSGQTIFGPSCANWKTSFSYLSLMRSAYAKLFTGEPNGCGIRTLPKLDKIISLDCDVIVCDTLRPLWNIDLTGMYFAAVPEHLSHWKPYGSGKYYNAGVCLFNLKAMREDGADDKLIQFLNTVKVPYIDQDAINWLNAEMGGTKALDMGIRYNECFVTGESLRPAVVHAAGEKHWWSNLEERYRGAYWQAYEKYCQWQACRDAGIKC